MKNFLKITTAIFTFVLIVLFFDAEPVKALQIVYPKSPNTESSASSTFFVGNTKPGSKLMINDKEVKVYENGSFVEVVPLKDGFNRIIIDSKNDTEHEIFTYIIKKVPKANLMIKEPETEDFPQNQYIYAAVAKENTPLRAQPDEFAQRITHLDKNTMLMLNGKKGDYYRVFLTPLKTAWVKAENIVNYSTIKGNILASATNVSLSEDNLYNYIKTDLSFPVPFKITETEKEKLVNLEKILHKRVVGQDEAVEAVAKAIRRSRVGLQDAKRPIGSFLFLGPTGVGKTELSKAIAEAMFDNENNIIRLDMSEYMEPHSVAKLIGAPPGYVGFDEGGQLTEAVRRKPYCVVLFDEIEKAHPDIFNALLQILDDGRLTDSQGRTVNFRNTIIIMTSNIGASEVQKRSKLGFETEESEEQTFDEVKHIYIDALRKKFKPEFLNRIDVTCVFHSLTLEDFTKIAKILMKNINKRLQKQGLELKLTERALSYIVSQGADAEYGARPLRRFIQQHVEDAIAEKILLGELEKSGTIIIDFEGGKLTFTNQESHEESKEE